MACSATSSAICARRSKARPRRCAKRASTSGAPHERSSRNQDRLPAQTRPAAELRLVRLVGGRRRRGPYRRRRDPRTGDQRSCSELSPEQENRMSDSIGWTLVGGTVLMFGLAVAGWWAWSLTANSHLP